jgi:hypothetical protein
VRLTAGGGAKKLSRLTAKLVKIRPVGKPGHDVSSAPGLAFRRDKKTILPGKHDVTGDSRGGLSPAREPGGTLQRRVDSLPDVAWPARSTTDLAADRGCYARCCQPDTACSIATIPAGPRAPELRLSVTVA